MPEFESLTNLGGTVITVVFFLWYLRKRDEQSRATADSGHKALAENTAAISQLNTNIALQRQALKSFCKAKD